MNPLEWQEAKGLLAAALDRTPAERDAFLADHCSNPDLRAEIEALLTDLGEAQRSWPAFVTPGGLDDLEDITPGSEIGPYSVIERLGRGGMGQVFLAHDSRLRRKVALKCLLSAGSAAGQHRSEILREARAVATITHPNVAAVYDVVERDARAFIVMEYVEGESLAARITRERLPFDSVLAIARELTSSLVAAHARGVIHRDLKPANIQMQPDGHVKVLDFGVAKRIVPASSTRSGVMADTTSVEIPGIQPGTPGYMSPEQILGREVDERTDLFSLGVVLYEMVSGHRPYRGTDPLDVIVALTRELPRIGEGDSRAAQGFGDVVAKLLAIDPSQRFQSAAELQVALEALDRLVRTSTTGRFVDGPAFAAGRRTHVLLASGVVIALIVPLSMYTFLRHNVHASTASKAPRRSVAVLGFKNVSGRPDSAWLSTAIAEELTTELAAGDSLRTIPEENVARMRNELALADVGSLASDTLERIHRNLGSDLVVLGSYVDLGKEARGQIRLDLRLQDSRSGDTIAAISQTGTEDDLFDLVSRSGQVLRANLGVGAISQAEAANVKASLPSNPAAARLYAEGLAKLRQFDALAGRDLLQQAVAADPNHALAHAALSSAWGVLGYDDLARREAARAFDLSSSLSRQERLWVEGRYRTVNKEPQKALDIYRSLFQFFPDNIEYGLTLADAQTSRGVPKEGLATLDALRVLPNPDKDDPRIDLAEARAAQAIGDFHREQLAAARAVATAEAKASTLSAARAQVVEARAFDDLGESDHAIALYQQARTAYSRTGDRGGTAAALLGLGIEFEERGNYADARRACDESLAIRREIGNQSGASQVLNEIAIILRHEGDLSQARKVFEEAGHIQHELGDYRSESHAIGNIGNVLDDEGDVQGAKAAYEQSLAISRTIGDQLGQAISLGNIAGQLVALGETAAARKDYEEALRISSSIGNKYFTTFGTLSYADFLRLTGDLALARRKNDEAMASAILIKQPTFVAGAHQVQGDLQAAAGDLQAAQNEYQAAAKLFLETGDKGSLAEARLCLAQVRLNQDNAPEAIDLATQATQEFETEKARKKAANAQLVLARAQLRAGQLAVAVSTLQRAQAVSAKNQDRRLHLFQDIVSAEIAAASAPHSPTPVKRLKSSVDRAHTLGFVAQELEARLILGTILMKSSADGGRAELARLERDASARGFTLVASQASAAAR